MIYNVDVAMNPDEVAAVHVTVGQLYCLLHGTDASKWDKCPNFPI